LRVEDVCWAPPEWTLCGFPLTGPDIAEVRLDTVTAVLLQLAATISEADSVALGPAMHVAHMLVTRQGIDGRWPARLDARTGAALSNARTYAPIALFECLAEALQTSEFDRVLERAVR